MVSWALWTGMDVDHGLMWTLSAVIENRADPVRPR